MSEAPEATRESQLRSARLRGIVSIGVTAILAVVAYLWLRSTFDAPPGACKSSTECGMVGAECLHAPTGAYCTHSCSRNEDCDPGMHCEVPPWENGATRALCIHDSSKIGGP